MVLLAVMALMGATLGGAASFDGPEKFVMTMPYLVTVLSNEGNDIFENSALCQGNLSIMAMPSVTAAVLPVKAPFQYWYKMYNP